MKFIKNLTSETFDMFGKILELNQSVPENFQVIINENGEVGWRIALSRITNRSIEKIARHPDTRESFEPLYGVAVLCVALPDCPEGYEIFLLDKPVCLYKNIWHAILSLSEYAVIKICENHTVTSEVYELNASIIVCVG